MKLNLNFLKHQQIQEYFNTLEQQIINKILTLNFGIGLNLSKKIHEQLGFNNRKSPLFIKRKLKDKIEIKYLKNKTGKDLKLKINNFLEFKKKTKTYTQLKSYKKSKNVKKIRLVFIFFNKITFNVL